MPTTEPIDLAAELRRLAREARRDTLTISAYEADLMEGVAAELERLRKGHPPGGKDHILTDPEWRALAKPIVLAMHRQELRTFALTKDGGDVRVEMGY